MLIAIFDDRVEQAVADRFPVHLDVFEQDPVPGHHPLLALDNVLATPHIGGATADQVSGLIENLELFLAGRRPRRLANPGILDLGTARAKHLQTP